MIEPLASTGDNHGVWFVGDQDPAIVEFDSTTKGFDYSLCFRVANNEYININRLSHRPVDIVMHHGVIWFIDYTSSVALYSLERQGEKSHNVSLQGIMESESAPTDLVSMQDTVYVCFGNQTLQVHTFDGDGWDQLPSLDVSYARVASFNGTLLAAAPHELGAALWEYENGEWNKSAVVTLQGIFASIEVKDDWPLLVSVENHQGNIVGLQHMVPVHIASFPIPKGRWSTIPSPEGICVLGVERNGTVTSIDIGWPSGSSAGSIELQLGEGYTPSFITRYPIIFAAVLFLIFLFVRSRSQK